MPARNFAQCPEKITPLIEEKIAEHRAAYDDIYVLYADCGTGGFASGL